MLFFQQLISRRKRFFFWKSQRQRKFFWLALLLVVKGAEGPMLLLFWRLTAENNDDNSTCHFKMTSVTNVVIKIWQEKTMTVILLEVKSLYHLWRKNKRFCHLVCHPWEMMMTDDRCGKKMLLRSVAKWQSHLPSRSLKKKGDDSCHRKWRWPSFSRWLLPTSNCS